MTAANKGGAVRLPRKRPRYPFISRLAEIRVAKSLPRIDLAEAAGYHVMILGRYERGETIPSVQRLVDWCDALGCEIIIREKAA